MISYIKIKNFQSISDVTLDLRGPYGTPKKIAFLYGENGVGKTNVINSIFFLVRSMETLSGYFNLSEYINNNDLSKHGINMPKEIYEQILSHRFPKNAKQLYDEYKMVDCTDSMILEYGFYIDKKSGYYHIELKDGEIINEKLYYIVGTRHSNLFNLSKKIKNLSPTIFKRNKIVDDLTNLLDKYWGKHSILSILNHMFDQFNNKFIKENIDANLIKIYDFFNQLSVSSASAAKVSCACEIFTSIENGTIDEKEKPMLKTMETFLTSFFSGLYSDIKSVHYETKKTSENQIKYNLFFDKYINSKLLSIDHQRESSGTKNLLRLLPIIYTAQTGSTVFVDEFDNGMHDVLISTIVEILNESMEGQLISTTHNTMLLEYLPPESVYIISSDVYGKKAINCISAYKKRIQKTHNLRNRYLNGDFDGIPHSGYVDFELLVDEFKETI